MASSKKVPAKVSTKRAETAEGLADRFDRGEDVSDHIDHSQAWRLNVELPGWMIAELDREATRLGTSRLHVLKTLVDDGLRRIRERDSKRTGS
jgi:hypothetical protein